MVANHLTKCIYLYCSLVILKMAYFKEVQDGLENLLPHLSDIHSFGRYLETVSIYPVFLSVHCILVALALRNHDYGMVLSVYFTFAIICNASDRTFKYLSIGILRGCKPTAKSLTAFHRESVIF